MVNIEKMNSSSRPGERNEANGLQECIETHEESDVSEAKERLLKKRTADVKAVEEREASLGAFSDASPEYINKSYNIGVDGRLHVTEKTRKKNFSYSNKFGSENNSKILLNYND